MSTEVIERMQFALDTAQEAVDALQERINEVAVSLKEPKQLTLPLWDTRIQTDAIARIAWRYVNGYQIIVSLADVDLLARSLRVDFHAYANQPGRIRVGRIGINLRVSDPDSAGKAGIASLGRLVLARAGTWLDEPGREVHHKNHNVLDCSRENMECVTIQKNREDRRPKLSPILEQQLLLPLEPAA